MTSTSSASGQGAGERGAKPVIGIVGGIGSGKSLAASMFGEMGCAVIDVDRIGHDVLAEPEVIDAVRRRWSDAVINADGSVDRGALGRIVFADPAEMTALREISWPRIGERLARQVGEALADGAFRAVVVDAAVLFEAGWDANCTHVVFVDAPEALRRERVARRGWSAEELERRENQQIPLDSKRRRCYATLHNRSSEPHLREQVRQLLERIAPAAE